MEALCFHVIHPCVHACVHLWCVHDVYGMHQRIFPKLLSIVHLGIEMHTEMWIRFRLCIQVYKCQHSMAPGYLTELCRPVSNIDSHRHLRDVPRVRLSTYRGRTFWHAGPSAWNALSDFLKNDALSLSTFRRQLKHFYFSLYYRGHSRLFYS